MNPTTPRSSFGEKLISAGMLTQDGAVLPTTLAPDARVAEGQGAEHDDAERHHPQRRPGSGQGEMALREHEGPVFEKEGEERFH